MTRRPAFWLTLALLGLAGSILAYKLFPVAFPILSVDIEMDRGQALDRARELAEEFQWAPEDFDQAASFGHQDRAFQTYMELEGGGLSELNRLVERGDLFLYAWRVRHFTPGAVEEASIRFSPLGEAYGFRLRLKEDAPGASLSTEEAEELARRQASADWGIEPDVFELLESSQTEQPGGRLDHTFVYERSGVELGEARVRLRLVVAGDQLAEVTHFVHVPDAFLRRYQDTRSANESISLAGTIVFLLIFLGLGGGIGGVHLLRNRWLEWKAPLIWGGTVAGLMALASLNSMPLAWMEYDTALPPRIFVGMQVVMACLTLLAGTFFLALVFMVGEGLMRLGFPDHIQQWRFWTADVARSTPALGRTLAPYLIVGLEVGFVVAFYLVTSRLAGWWSPASALAEPDLLATPFPWLTAVGTSLFAAFSEETIFRAIPIGAAAIIGRRQGRAGLWIWGTVVLQALVFGASHANYPQQPAYARVVEIFPTYLGWGAVCVYFGLIPSIIAHFVYDLIFFSLPLFVAETSGIWASRIIVLAAGALPLAVVLGARWRKGAASSVPEGALNRAWTPPSPSSREEASTLPGVGRTPATNEAAEGLSPPLVIQRGLPRRWALVLGIAALSGIGLWFGNLDPSNSPSLVLSRSEARAAAETALTERGVDLGPDWTPQFSISSERGLSHQFVWQEGSAAEYQEMTGSFLNTPGWRVRFVNFRTNPEERAESYLAFPSHDRPLRISHFLPEGRPGGALSEEEARGRAQSALRSQLGTNPDHAREISAEEVVQPNRTDWTFTFSTQDGYTLPRGEGRIEVRIAGDEIVGTSKFVHVPEDWEREWRADQSRRTFALIPSAALLLILALAAVVLALTRWSRGSLFLGPVRVLAGSLGGITLVTALNEWPNTASTFSTQASLGNQTVTALLGMATGLAVVAMGVGLIGGLGHTWLPNRSAATKHSAWIGLALGAAYVGYSGTLSTLGPGGPPDWPTYMGAVTFLPWLSSPLAALMGFLTLTAVAVMIIAAFERSRGTRWWWTGPLLALLIGLTLAPNPTGASWLFWLGGAVAFAASIGLLWILSRSLGWAIIPGAMATPLVLEVLETGIKRPFPGTGLGSVLAVLALVTGVILWTRFLSVPKGPNRNPSRVRPEPGYTPEPILDDAN